MKVNPKFNINNNLHHNIKQQTFTGKTLKDLKRLKKNPNGFKDVISLQTLGLSSIKMLVQVSLDRFVMAQYHSEILMIM